MTRTLMFVTAPSKEEAYELAKPLIPDYLKEGGRLLLEASGVNISKVKSGSVVLFHLTGSTAKVDIAEESLLRHIVLVANSDEELAEELRKKLPTGSKVFTCEGNFGEGIRYIRYDTESDYSWIRRSSFVDPYKGAICS